MKLLPARLPAAALLRLTQANPDYDLSAVQESAFPDSSFPGITVTDRPLLLAIVAINDVAFRNVEVPGPADSFFDQVLGFLHSGRMACCRQFA